MKNQKIGKSKLISSRLAYGCMRVAGAWKPVEVTAEFRKNGKKAILSAYDSGYTLFDHADVYCDGVSESIFGEVLKENSAMRKEILVATKCGIHWKDSPNLGDPHRWDFSYQHIIDSCEKSLKRLNVDYIDIYQLHRPDYLTDPDEISKAFSMLKKQGKVLEFGVSNFRPSLLKAVQKACLFPLIVNQVEISLVSLNCFTDGTLDQCLEENITPLSWSPLGRGILGDSEKANSANGRKVQLSLIKILDQIAKKHNSSRTAVSLAWLLKHPSGIIPIVGSTNPEHIRAAVQADNLELTREDWYKLLSAAQGPLP
jgi:predicted oxidoreductase